MTSAANASIAIALVLLLAPSLSGAQTLDAHGKGKDESLRLKRVVVLDLLASDVPNGLAQNLSELMVSTLREVSSEATVIAQSEIDAMLTLDQTKIMLGCTEASCLAEVGGALGADHLLTGKIGRIGSIFILGLKVIDNKRARVVRHRTLRVAGNEEALIDAIVRLATEMVTGEATTKPTVTAALAPPPLPPTTVLTARQPAEVDDGSSWYQKWWVWTLVGVAVAGAVTGVVLTTGEQEGGGSFRINIAP